MWFGESHPFSVRGSPTRLSASGQQSYKGWSCGVGSVLYWESTYPLSWNQAVPLNNVPHRGTTTQISILLYSLWTPPVFCGYKWISLLQLVLMTQTCPFVMRVETAFFSWGSLDIRSSVVYFFLATCRLHILLMFRMEQFVCCTQGRRLMVASGATAPGPALDWAPRFRPMSLSSYIFR